MAKRDYNPFDFKDPANLQHAAEQCIPRFARFSTTSEVVDWLVKHQEERVTKKYHKTRKEIRESIRTINPNNAKFNKAKWGELYEECRAEYVADMRNQMCDTVSRITRQINIAVRHARLGLLIRTPEQLHEVLKLIQTLQDIQSTEESRVINGVNELTKKVEEALDTEDNAKLQSLPFPVKSGDLGSPSGTNGHADTV